MKKIILAVIVVLIGLGFFGYSKLGGAVKSIIESAGSQAVGTAVHVGGLDVSLSNRTASINTLSVANPSGFKDDFLKAKSISATLGGVENKTVTIKEVVVDGMTVTYQLGANGSNFDALKRNSEIIFLCFNLAPSPKTSSTLPKARQRRGRRRL